MWLIQLIVAVHAHLVGRGAGSPLEIRLSQDREGGTLQRILVIPLVVVGIL